MCRRTWLRRFLAGVAAGLVVVGADALTSVTGSGASAGKPMLAEAVILRIARAAAAQAGDPSPTLIQHSAGSRARANLIDSGAIVPGRQWSYLIAERGHFVLNNAPTPSGASALSGSVLTQIVNATTGQITDGGVSDRYPNLARLGPVRTDLRDPGGRSAHPVVANVPSEPILSPLQRSQIEAAQTAAAVRDPACSPVPRNIPEFSDGRPSTTLTSLLGVLRAPASRADATQIARLPIGVFTGPVGSSPPPGQGAELAAGRRARTALGTTFYIVPASDETGLRPVPVRCEAEQRAALTRALPHAPTVTRDQTIELQHQYLAWEGYRGRHREGIILGTITAHAVGVDGTASVDEIRQHGLLDGNAGYPGRTLISGIVPDGVATVTLTFPTVRVRANVVNNVYVGAQPRHAGSLQTVTWRAADGRPIKTLAASTQRRLTDPGLRAAATNPVQTSPVYDHGDLSARRCLPCGAWSAAAGSSRHRREAARRFHGRFAARSASRRVAALAGGAAEAAAGHHGRGSAKAGTSGPAAPAGSVHAVAASVGGRSDTASRLPV
jgi:hypothetical protein